MLNFNLIFIPTSKKFQVSAPPLAAEAASLIENETFLGPKKF